MSKSTTAIGGVLCLLLVLVLGGCGSSAKKADASKVEVQGTLSSDQCAQVQSALSTLDGVPNGSVVASDVASASTTVSSAVGATSMAMQTVLVAVNAAASAPAEQYAATVSSVTSGGGYATALGRIHEAVDRSCS